MAAKADLRGRRFDRVMVLYAVQATREGQMWLCVCDCGNHFFRRTGALLKGSKHTACPRCRPDIWSRARAKHGASRTDAMGGKERLYTIWRDMRKRCRNPKVRTYKHYGGRGIEVCPDWATYPPFREWALSHGYTDKLSIERKDSNGHYNPLNCEWITRAENTARRNRELRGVKLGPRKPKIPAELH